MVATNDLGAVVVHFSRWPGVLDTVRDAIAGGIDPDRVVVVDNGSPDHAASEFKSLFPEATWLSGHGNVGYAGAVNLGIEALALRGCAAALVLTHEVRFDSDLPRSLLSALGVAGAGAAAPRLRLLSDAARVWSEGGDINRLTCLPRSRQHLDQRSPDWVDGCCFVIRVEDFFGIGGMYEPYFLYMEEVDFFARLRDRNLSIVIPSDSFAQQEPGGMSLYYATRNRILLARRIGSRFAFPLVLLETVARLIHSVVTHPLAGRRKQRERYVALKDGLRLARGAKFTTR